MTILMLTIVAFASNSKNILTDINSIYITQEEFDLAKKTQDFYETQSVTRSSPNISNYTNDSTMNNLICRKIIESLFKEHNIDLSLKERNYVNNYCIEMNKIINEMILNGNDEEKENALVVLQIKIDERNFCGLTEEQADSRETKEVEYTLKLKKLINTVFNGNESDLISYIDNVSRDLK